MSNQRRAAVGQGGSGYGLLAVGGQYLTGTTPNRPNLIIYDTKDWSVWDSKISGADENNILLDIAEDDNYIYLCNLNAPYFQVYIKATKSFMSGVAALPVPSSAHGIHVDSTTVYVNTVFNLYKYAKSDFGTITALNSVYSSNNALTGDNANVYGMIFSTTPDEYRIVNKSAFTSSGVAVTGTNVTNTSLASCVNDSSNVYFGCGNSSTQNRFLVMRKSDNATISAQYTVSNTTIRAMTQDTDYVFFGVSNGEFRRVVKSSLTIETAAQTFDSAIWCLLNLGDTIAVGGEFTDKFKLVPKSNLAITVSGTPALAGTVRSLCLIS